MKIPKATTPQAQAVELQKKLQDASKLYEQQFLQEMVRAMRGTVTHSAFTEPSMAEKIYREQLDQQYVEQWSDRGGVGFADVIYRDLVDKYYPFLKGPQQKKIRPVELSDNFKGIVKKFEKPQANQQGYVIALHPSEKSSELKLPWKSVVEKEFKLPDGRQYVKLQHPNGLRSQMVFQGQVKPGLTNKVLSAGENFAELQARVKSMVWQIEVSNPQKSAVGATEEEF